MRKRACDSCHRRKIQCDAVLPQCNWCQHHNLNCTFTRPVGVKKSKAKPASSAAPAAPEDPARDLSLRIGPVEDALASARISQQNGQQSPQGAYPSPSGSSIHQSAEHGGDTLMNDAPAEHAPLHLYSAAPSALSPGTRPVARKNLFTGYALCSISSYNGLPFFSAESQQWIESRTGVSAGLQELCAQGPIWQTHHRLRLSDLTTDMLKSGSALDMPPKHAAEGYFGKFRESGFKLVFPIVDPLLFETTIEKAYEPTGEAPASLEAISAKACVFAFFGLTSLAEGVRTIRNPVDGDQCEAKAQYLIPRLLHEPSIDALQTILMVCMYHLFSGQPFHAAHFHSLGCRIMFTLGAHLRSDLGPVPDPVDRVAHRSWRARCHLRTLFWLCYTFDKEISLRTGQPPSIDDDYCDLTLPSGYLDGQFVDRKDSAAGDVAIPLLPGDLRLTLIKSKICKTLYSAGSLRKSDAQLLRDIRELDENLENWRLSTPPDFRPPLLVSSRQPRPKHASLPPHINMQVMIIHFEYHYLMSTIHQACGRCSAWAQGGSGEMEGVSSSLELSVEASRSTLSYLAAAIHALREDAFWMLVFYPMSAVLNIFCKILLTPLDDRACEDLDLLNTAPELIRCMRVTRLSENETKYMQLVDDFVKELIRLGNHAIIKARRERSASLGPGSSSGRTPTSVTGSSQMHSRAGSRAQSADLEYFG